MSVTSFSQVVKLKSPSENRYVKDAVVQVFLPAQEDVALMLDKHSSEMVTYEYFYLKNAVTNDIYTFDYGDFKDADLSFEAFIKALVAKRKKQ